MKKLFRVALAFLLVFMLVGCMKYTITVNVNKDGTANLVMEQLILKEYLSDEDFESMYQENLVQIADVKGATVKKVEKKIDNKDYRGTLIEYPNAIGSDQFGDELAITVKDNTISIKLPLDGLGDAMQSEDVDLSTLKAMGASMVLIINMPGEIIESSGGEAKGKTLTVDLLSFSGKEISATAKIGGGGSGGNMLYYLIGGGAALVVVGLAVVVLGKKKNSAAAE